MTYATDPTTLRAEARDIEIGAPDGDGYAGWLRACADRIEAIETPAQRFAAAVSALFEDDPNWSVLDLEGAAEFFASINYTPPTAATELETS